jgi:hypothetical protein
VDSGAADGCRSAEQGKISIDATTLGSEMERLEPFVGEWEMEVSFPGPSPIGGARTTFEWMPGERLLVQRWEIPIPEAPDGLAVYGGSTR